MSHKIGNWVLSTVGIIFLLCLFVLVVSAVQEKQTTKAQDLVVNIVNQKDSLHLIDSEDIRKTIARNFGHSVKGIPLEALEIKKIENLLREDPFIYNAEVFIDAKNRVNVNLEQRQPLVRVIDEEGKHYYMDEEGVKIPLSAHLTVRVPVMTGKIPSKSELNYNEVQEDVFLICKKIKEDEFLQPMVEQIHRNAKGEYTFVPKIGKQKIVFGKTENVDEKIENLKIFYKEAMTRHGWSKYQSINLKYDGQIVCSK